MSDGHYDAPAYCALCGRPCATGPMCTACTYYVPDMDEDEDDET